MPQHAKPKQSTKFALISIDFFFLQDTKSLNYMTLPYQVLSSHYSFP